MRRIGSEVTRIVYEPTGPYHRGFECRLAEAGQPLVKVNPRQARRFAEATGKLAKTDRCDAAMLARMGAVLALTARPLCSALLNELKDLHIARAALIKDRTAAMRRSKPPTPADSNNAEAHRASSFKMNGAPPSSLARSTTAGLCP
jgi:transposase